MVVERLQSVSHADLKRLVPRLFPDEPPPRWQGELCLINFRCGLSLRIELDAEQERRIAALRLVSTPLRFVFTGWPPARVDVVMRRIEQALQQGGG